MGYFVGKQLNYKQYLVYVLNNFSSNLSITVITFIFRHTSFLPSRIISKSYNLNIRLVLLCKIYSILLKSTWVFIFNNFVVTLG